MDERSSTSVLLLDILQSGLLVSMASFWEFE